jgi:hypothetical protein
MTMAAELPDLFLGRLRRLANIRADRESEFNPEGLAMIDRAIFSTLRDCQKVGARTEAIEILRTAGLEHPAPGRVLR